MIYNILYYNEFWQRHAYGDSSVPLRPLDATDRAQATNIDYDGHVLWWDGFQWTQHEPEQVTKRVRSAEFMAAVMQSVVGVREGLHPGGSPQDHGRIGQHVWLRRTDPAWDDVPAKITDAGHRCFKVWLPEYRQFICVDSTALRSAVLAA